MMGTVMRGLRGWGYLIVSCAGLAALADWLFYMHVMGWSAAVFLLCMMGVVIVRSLGAPRSPAGWGLMMLCAGMVLALADEPTPVGVAMALLLLGMVAMMRRGRWTWSLRAWAGRWSWLAVRGPMQALTDLFTQTRWFWRHPQYRGARLARGIIRWALPVAVGGAFAGLFALANPVVESWVRAVWEKAATVFDWLPEVLAPGRVALWGGVMIGAYALLRYRQPGWARTRPEVLVPPRMGADGGAMAASLVVRGLIVCNAVFAVQSALDIYYLWGGARLPAGLTYAAYAHRGAYPLIATALLAAAMVIVCFRRGGAAARSPVARRLVFLWIAQNLFLLASTIERLWLYVSAYSLTRCRLAAMIWVAIVALGFAWIVIKIVMARTNAWLVRVNVVTVLAVLYVGAFCNFSGWIAAFNVRHCREVHGEGPPLDVAYLQSLGVAALPALVSVRRVVPVGAAERTLRQQLAGEMADWRGWTWRRAQVARSITSAPTRSVAMPGDGIR